MSISDYPVLKIADLLIPRPTFERSLSPGQCCFHLISFPSSSSTPPSHPLAGFGRYLTSFKAFREILLSSPNKTCSEEKINDKSFPLLCEFKKKYISSSSSVRIKSLTLLPRSGILIRKQLKYFYFNKLWILVFVHKLLLHRKHRVYKLKKGQLRLMK